MKLTEITDNRPLVWQLAAIQLEKGRTVRYHAHLPESETFFSGLVAEVGQNVAIATNVFGKALIPILEDDDDRLHIRESGMSVMGNYVIEQR